MDASLLYLDPKLLGKESSHHVGMQVHLADLCGLTDDSYLSAICK